MRTAFDLSIFAYAADRKRGMMPRATIISNFEFVVNPEYLLELSMKTANITTPTRIAASETQTIKFHSKPESLLKPTSTLLSNGAIECRTADAQDASDVVWAFTAVAHLLRFANLCRR